MPVEEHGEFFSLIEKTQGGFSEPIARQLFRNLVDSVDFIHSRNIGHRDIKTENLLLTGEFVLKLCDMGSSCTLQKNGKDDIVTPMEAIGSPEYNPPELNTNEASDSESAIKAGDIFSLGCVLFLMVVKCLPFQGAGPHDPYYSRLIGNNSASFWKIFLKACPSLSPEFKDLFERMTRRYPEDRISLAEIKKHPWTNSSVEPLESFFITMSQKVAIVSQVIRNQAIKAVEKFSCVKDNISAQSHSKADQYGLPDQLKKVMIEYKQKMRKIRIESLALVHTSSKSSSQDDSAGFDQEEKPARKLKEKNSQKMSKTYPIRFKRSDEDSWSSPSDNEDQTNY